MIRAITTFVVLLGAVYLGIMLSKDPGYVLIAVNHWTIETTFWVATVGLLLLFLILHALIQLWNKLAKTPRALHNWHIKNLEKKAQETTRKGLIEYSEGYWLKAKNHLIKALPNTDTPLLNYLTAARAAQKMGDSKLRDQYLREAQKSVPDAKIAVELTQAQLQLANNQWEQALATLRHLKDLAPNHPYVLKLLMHLYEEIKDWQQLIALLPEIKRNRVLSNEALLLIQQRTYLHAIEELAKQNQVDAINDLMHSLPRSLTYDPEITVAYTRYLYANSEYAHAETFLRRCLQKNFHPQLINLYGLIAVNEKQLGFAESLLKKYPHSAPLHLCIARLCLEQHLWGKAKSHLEQAIELDPTPITYLTLGQLHEQLEETSLANVNYKKGLELATSTTASNVDASSSIVRGEPK